LASTQLGEDGKQALEQATKLFRESVPLREFFNDADRTVTQRLQEQKGVHLVVNEAGERLFAVEIGVNDKTVVLPETTKELSIEETPLNRAPVATSTQTPQQYSAPAPVPVPPQHNAIPA